MAPRVLTWIYAWGEPTAWAIKVGVVVLGGALWLLGKNDTNEDE